MRRILLSRGISGTSLEKVLSLDPLKPSVGIDRKTKIVCTVGPSTWDEKGIEGLLNAGMNVMRLNCSHGDHSLYEKCISILRKACSEKQKAHALVRGNVNVSCAVALDTKGPEIRLGDFEDQSDSPKLVEVGQKLNIHTNDKMKKKMDQENLYADYKTLGNSVHNGGKIFIDDGLLSLTVTGKSLDKDGFDIVQCTADNSSVIGSRKGVNLPGAELDLPAVSEKDKKDLQFAKDIGVDFIFASFIRKRDHIRDIRKIVGPDIKIIAKIENQEGIQNINGIISEADGVMIARGDLGIEIPQENVFLAQKLIVSKSNLIGKPAICATQMLDSMSRSPRPTRAECGDVANAVLDGCDAVMLSGETANGKYPFKAVETMSKICKTAEYSNDFRQTMEAIRVATAQIEKPACEALVVSAVVAAFEEKAKLLIVITATGESVRIAAKYRPSAAILCITTDPLVARKMQLCYGVHILLIPVEMELQESITVGLKKAHFLGLVEEEDRVVAVHSKGHGMRLIDVPKWISKM